MKAVTQAIKERPILFSEAMIRAILEGRKTQTRRVVKWKVRQKGLNLAFSGLEAGFYHSDLVASGYVLRSRGGAGGCWNDRTWPIHCPYGQPGDRLWVRESFSFGISDNPADKGQVGFMFGEEGDGLHPDSPKDSAQWCRTWKKKPSIFMPRWASRIALEVIGVRIERLHEISEADAKAEGVKPFPKDPEGDCFTDGLHRTAYQFLWNEINGWRGPKCWDANPWVWVVEFRRVQG